MNADTDLLDLDEFTELFESGKLDHLTKKTKTAQKKVTKPALRLADPLPTSIVPLVERITCKGCGAVSQFLKSYGLKTVRRNHTSITAITGANKKQFDLLVEQDCFEAPIVSEQFFQSCCKCTTHKWKESNG